MRAGASVVVLRTFSKIHGLAGLRVGARRSAPLDHSVSSHGRGDAGSLDQGASAAGNPGPQRVATWRAPDWLASRESEAMPRLDELAGALELFLPAEGS